MLEPVPGTQAEHLLHRRDASFRYGDFPHASAAEGPVLNIVNHHCCSLGSPDTLKDVHIIDNISATRRPSLARSFDDKSDESHVAGIAAKPNLNSSSGEGKADHTTSIHLRARLMRSVYIMLHFALCLSFFALFFHMSH